MLTVEIIKQAVLPLTEKYNIAKVDLFGSYADGNATEKSDADFLVKFNVETPSIFKVMGFKQELETILNYPVDVITMPIKRQDKLRIRNVVNVYDRAG